MNKKTSNSKEYIFGIRAIIENILAGKEIDKVLIQKGLKNPLIKELIQIVRKYNIPYQNVPADKLNRVTRKNHQGAIAFISAVQYASLDNVINECYQQGKEPFLLVLDRITDVRNFGAIARTAECAGIDSIIIPSRGSAAVNADAMKTSAGALSHIPVCRTDDLKKTLDFIHENGIRIIGCTEKTSESIYELDLSGPIAIVMGSEEDGISREYLKKCDVRGSIPMAGKIDSLNVSVSAGIITFEAVRQRATGH